ncbi:MAG: CvpA family protein [Candidatus Adiutrix sp.]|jgi:membrane protein required for colicin V production|nr:CvpA family protein [Candidatus Adiutrix sp.]
MFEGGLDIALLVILGYFLLRGLFRGVVKEVVAVLGLFVAFWVAGVYWDLAEMHLKPLFDMRGQRGISAFIIIFTVVYFFTGMISIFMDHIVKVTISPVVSGLLGAVVGMIKGILVCGILMSGAQVFLKPGEPFFATSQLWPYLKPVTAQALAWMPEGLHRALTAKAVPEPLSGAAGRPGGGAATPAASFDSVDWKSIQDILKNNPEAILAPWRNKIQNLSGGEALSPEDIKRFISDHPNLLSRAPLPPGQNPAPAGTTPTWPQPATE